MMGWISEFKSFALRGNVVDLAVGFTVGAAFTTIAKSLVDDILMPPIGLVLGRVDFSEIYLLLQEGKTPAPYATLAEAKAAGAVTLNVGVFANHCLTLLIVAFAMFLIIRAINRMNERLVAEFGFKKTKPSDPDNKKCPYCLSTIPYQATRCAHCTSQLEPIAP